MSLALIALLGIVLLVLWLRWRLAVRAEFVRTFPLPYGLFDRLRLKHPSLSQKDCHLVSHALRHFFLAHLKSGRKFVSMPSQVADDLWHEFILSTKAYAAFCTKAFGQFMHHTPAVELGPQKHSNTGLRRCWWYTCLEENINPRKATRLPLLFALDAKLRIEGGFRYALDCRGQAAGLETAGGGTTHCGGDMSSTSFDGGTDGLGDGGAGDGGGGDGGGCGGGCGGGD